MDLTMRLRAEQAFARARAARTQDELCDILNDWMLDEIRDKRKRLTGPVRDMVRKLHEDEVPVSLIAYQTGISQPSVRAILGTKRRRK